MSRIAAAGIFLAVMLGAREIAHLGWIAIISLLSTAFAAGIIIENRMRGVTGRAPYSLVESRELAFPLSCLTAIMIVAYCIR